MKNKKSSIIRLVLFIILMTINIMFVIALFTTNTISNSHPDIWIKIFLVWLMISNTILHGEFSKLKLKTNFHYIDSLYRLKKKEKDSPNNDIEKS